MGSPIDECLTVRDWLHWAEVRFSKEQLFFGHGCDNAYDEAAWLILYALKRHHDSFDEIQDVPLLLTERHSILDILNRRITRRIPSAYLTHQAWLGAYEFYVDERVIVPRSYFSELLEHDLSPWLSQNASIHHALDLCTGSGCLAILMAQSFPDAKIDAIDLSKDALEVARMNVERYELENRIELIASDLFAEVRTRKYDLIISNPPYVTADAMNSLPDEYRHEPALALAAGREGLDIVRRILQSSADQLTPDGLLMVEVGHNADIVEAAYPDVPFTWIDTDSSEEKIFMLTQKEVAAFCRQ